MWWQRTKEQKRRSVMYTFSWLDFFCKTCLFLYLELCVILLTVRLFNSEVKHQKSAHCTMHKLHSNSFSITMVSCLTCKWSRKWNDFHSNSHLSINNYKDDATKLRLILYYLKTTYYTPSSDQSPLLVATGNAFSKWTTVKANRCYWNRNAEEWTVWHNNGTEKLRSWLPAHRLKNKNHLRKRLSC